MADRFSLDPEGVRRLSQELSSIRSEATGAALRPDAAGIAGSSAVEDAVRRFGDATARSHQELDDSLELLARWLKDVAAGQHSIDRMLTQHLSRDSIRTRSEK
ncbi:hypothetical protein [Micromonospora avicenniae]|uniref:Uncharacterized protein n=1 Tax=Micromonospora avicenniae TaxID=1198245 RepID=A0A1N6VFA2_9ACTN|nr:hypothetical protein [Micromonospora avicenniae]SIQ76593.1 hypothetical protein SAMN05444858_10497 [Micromonospora avicenniae]